MSEILHRDLKCGDCVVFKTGAVVLVLERTPFETHLVWLNSRQTPKPYWICGISDDEVYTRSATVVRYES